MKEMISVAQADKIIVAALKTYKPVQEYFLKSYGSLLQEDIKADRDQPAFDKSLMDGIAINSAVYKKGVRKFLIEGIQSAGMDRLALKFDHGCTEIMTGAVLTKGCDVVIPIEDVTIAEGKALVKDGLKLRQGQCIRPKGSDHKKGTVLLKKGCLLNPPQVSICASVGKAQVKVAYKPRVALISTGDELVDIGAAIQPYQIRRANTYFMQAALDKVGLFHAATFHFPDDKKLLLRQIRALIENFDVLVFTGGVSKGKFDYVPQVLHELGSKCLFHKVKQKPGKPFWFGLTKKRKPIFALPGNPVSTQVGTYRYVIKHLRDSIGHSCGTIMASLTKAFQPNTKFTFFVPVILKQDKQGKFLAAPVAFGGSGDVGSLGTSHGFMEIPSGGKKVLAGFKGTVYLW